ncbi:hypothetical protein AURDEDRAFT_163677 [Auricularia subglabra TFB-10046 SS5]|nr:hypothetical protein AURDEDRAFT_163677 [Auricularia subglabra TFB-10046 SS5]
MSPSFTFPLPATLLAHIPLAQFTDPTDVFVGVPALEALIPAAAQNANKAAAECLCTNPPERADMQACYKEHCPALQGQCLAVISDNGTPSGFIASNIYG